ncbi:MAG TPA: tyrosine-type recombinase/integrase [Oculatellaceae cyanobacterium]|jgi:integrase/recombinase XerC
MSNYAIAQDAGITKKLSPHRIRHSSVTAALEATNGDVRRVQKLSRHSNLNTLMIYDDNRLSHQGEITYLLADLV